MKESEGGERTSKKILGVFTSLLVVAMLALPMSATYATKPTPVSGTFYSVPNGTIETRFAGKSDNVIMTVIGELMWTGDIAGLAAYEGFWITHKGHTNARGISTVDATVNDKSGTLTIYQGSWSEPIPGLVRGHWRIISGTGDLANLHGQGTFEETGVPMVFAYTGQIHFDP